MHPGVCMQTGLAAGSGIWVFSLSRCTFKSEIFQTWYTLFLPFSEEARFRYSVTIGSDLS